MKWKNLDQQVEAAQQRLATLLESANEASPFSKELLREALTELSTSLTELQAAGEEMRLQNDELLTTRQALDTERQRYREMLFDFAPDGYLITDSRGVIQEANYAAANLLRVAPAFLLGKPLAVFVAIEERQALRKRLIELGRQSMPELPGQTWEVSLQPRHTPSIPVAITVAPKHNTQGELVSLRWLVRDVTQQKRVEAALRLSEAFNWAILNSLAAHIAVLDKEGTIVAVNERWKHFARENGDPGLTRTGVGINYLQVCRRTEGEFASPAQEALAGIQAVLAGLQSHFTLEYACPSPLEDHWFQMQVTPLADERGGAVIAHVDVTEHRQMENEKTRLLEEVQQQREELRALSRRLAEVQEVERKQLAWELHDRVGQHLTALDLNLNIIRTRLAEMPLKPDLIETCLDDSLILVDQTATSIRDVMASLHPPMLDDYGLAATLRWYGSQLAARTGFKLIVRDRPTLSRLAAPVENALFRIAQEALTNVAKHAQASKVTLKLEEKNGWVRMIVADNGRGFDSTGLAETNGRSGWGLMIISRPQQGAGI